MVPPTAQRLLWQFVSTYGIGNFSSPDACCLDDSYERNVVGSQLIKLDLQLVHIAGYIVIL